MIVQSTDSPVAHGRRARGDTDTPTGRTVATARANRHYATATSARRARGQHQQPAHPRHARVGRLDDHRARARLRTVARGEGHLAACLGRRGHAGGERHVAACTAVTQTDSDGDGASFADGGGACGWSEGRCCKGMVWEGEVR